VWNSWVTGSTTPTILGSGGPPQAGPWYPMDPFGANKHSMQIDASINLFGTKNNKWVMEPKYETPHYNFAHIQSGVGWGEDMPAFLSQSFIPPEYNTLSIPAHGSGSVPRGMWHQFGKTESTKGIYLEVGDIPSAWYQRLAGVSPLPGFLAGPHYRVGVPYSRGFCPGAQIRQNAASGRKNSIDISAAFYGGPFGAAHSPDNPHPASLAEIMGMKNRVKLGTTAPAKLITEAVVAVPFLIKDGERKFFPIPENTIRMAMGDLGKTTAGAEAISVAGAAAQAAVDALASLESESLVDANNVANSAAQAAAFAASTALTQTQNEIPHKTIVDMVNKMKRYIFPPRMDFVKNIGDIEPFAMYIFEFGYTLSQCELSKIWQNVLPDIGQTMVKRTASISHQLLSNELMGNFKGTGQEPMKDEVQWMVFKVKKRANNNYFSKVSQEGENSEKTRQYDYSYNWPYDYFSLIECAKIGSTIGFGTETDKNRDIENFNEFGGSDLLNKGIRATRSLPDPLATTRAEVNSQNAQERAQENKEKRKEEREQKRRQGPFGEIKKK